MDVNPLPLRATSCKLYFDFTLVDHTNHVTKVHSSSSRQRCTDRSRNNNRQLPRSFPFTSPDQNVSLDRCLVYSSNPTTNRWLRSTLPSRLHGTRSIDISPTCRRPVSAYCNPRSNQEILRRLERIKDRKFSTSTINVANVRSRVQYWSFLLCSRR